MKGDAPNGHNDNLDFIEVQGTGEEKAFSKEQFIGLLDLVERGSMPYSAVTHPVFLSCIHLGTAFSTLALHIT